VKKPKAKPPGDSADDAAWIRAAVEQYERPLTAYAANFVGDVDRARDVVQDTFLKLWTADRAGVDGHLAAWLYRVCRNRALDVCRKEVRMTTLESEQLEFRESVRSRQQHAPPEEFGAVMAELACLPPTQQEAVRLKFQGGLSYQEIATVMDITANHVGVLIHTALKAIRERLPLPDLNMSHVSDNTERRGY
jgi:RNA polymerase sigma factor (sigma-70 family)